VPTLFPTDAHPTIYPTVGTPTVYPSAETASSQPSEAVVILSDDAAPSATPVVVVVEPSAQPVDAPVEAPVEAPVAAPSAAPSEGPVEAPVESPVETPVESPVESPVATPSTDDYPTPGGFNVTTFRDGYPTLSYFTSNRSEILHYKFLDAYSGVVEPYADMWVYPLDGADEEPQDGFNYKYTICAEGDGATITVNVDVATGETQEVQCVTADSLDASFNFDCTPLEDTFSITVEKEDATTGEATGDVAQGKLMCVYVRREFRALTEADLEKTMDSMWKMWEVSEEEGQELYGDDFHNYAYLLEFHYFNAAWIHSDHIHEGNGFMAQHIKMSNIFEKSMQRVDPSISLPYWDFTIEKSQNISVWDSPLFTEDTFGTMPLPNNLDWGWLFSNNSIDDGKVLDGRWQDFPAEPNTKYTDLDYAYGYMRAPWNMNPSKYLTRYTSIDKELPSCSSHYELLEYSSLVDFLHQSPYDAHASTHGVIGGVYGCDVLDYMRELGYINGVEGQINLCKNWIFYVKEFYRSAVLLPDKDCVAQDANGVYNTEYDNLQCQYVCNPDRLNILILMLERSVLNSDYDCVPTVDEMPEEGWVEWRKFICDGGDGYKLFGGDHLESASPADPSFWPIHPTLERVLQAKYMAGGFDTDEWPTDADSEYVCNKATCYEEDEAAFGEWDSCCYGHYQDDQMLDAPNADRYTGVGPTNREVHDDTNPTNEAYGMPYIYDEFQWDHCLEYEGVDFNFLINGLYNNSLTFNVSSPDTEKGWRQ